jgi:membrane protein DedA with SNARE-associated domain
MLIEDLLLAVPRLLGNAAEASPLLGYGAIAVAMLLETVVAPVPAELILPFAGYLVHEGRLALVPVILAGLLGSVLGAWCWYGLGRIVNERRLERFAERHGSLVGLSPAMLAASRRWFARHGAALVFWGRIVPGVRTFVSVPAGIELMPQSAFLAWTAAGSLLWVSALTLAGLALGANYQRVFALLEPLGQGIVALLLSGAALLLVLLAWRRRRARDRR